MLLSLVLVLVLVLLVGVFFFIKSSPTTLPVLGVVVPPKSTPQKYRCHVATKDTCMVTKHTCPSFSKPKAVGWLLMRANDGDDDDGDDGDDGADKEAKCTQLIDEDGCNQYTCYTPVFATKEECEATCL